MAKLKGTVLASPVVPSDSLDTYPTHSAEYGKGGHKSVNNISDLNLIPLARREEGMTVYVISEESDYRLKGGIADENWVKEESNSLDPTILNSKVDKETGKGLSEENYTTAEKNKLANLTDNFKGGYSDSTDRDGSLVNPKDNWYVLQHDTDTIWYYKNSVWVNTGNKSTGDMLKAIYDPTGKNADSFLMSNMVETLDAKIMTSAERTKLANVEEGAQVNTVSKVNNKTGNVILDKTDVGLDKVDNTPDIEKSVATAGKLTNPVKING